MVKTLITGANGFLGYYMVKWLLDHGHDVIATGKGECRLPFEGTKGFTYASMDITDPYEVHDVFAAYSPKIVIHAAAMTKPDDCEQDQWQAYVTNVEATITMLINAEEQDAYFIFLSTDFVFDGEKGMYEENDTPSPVNYYGRTKLEAEEAVREYPGDWAIARTVLVYGKPQMGRQNILTVVKDKLEKGETYSVVDDQFRTPTYVEDLAGGIGLLIENSATGVYHISGDELMTPYQMARAVARHLKLDEELIKRVTAADFTQPARRPRKTGFNISRIKQLGFSPLSFAEGLSATFK